MPSDSLCPRCGRPDAEELANGRLVCTDPACLMKELRATVFRLVALSNELKKRDAEKNR